MKGTRHVNGYSLVYCPGHPNQFNPDSKNWGGWLYEHIKVASEKIGRPIADYENVHHIDGNRANNAPENLQVVGNNEHAMIHVFEKLGKTASDFEDKPCLICGSPSSYKCNYCSLACSREANKRLSKKPSKEELEKLLQKNPIVSIAVIFNVTDNAVRKWLISYGLPAKLADRKANGYVHRIK